MIETDRESRAVFERLGHGFGELEAQEMHRRGFPLVLPFEILVCDGPDSLMRFYPDPCPVLNAQQLSEPLLAFLRIGVFEHHRRLEIAAVRNKRVVRVELLPDAFFLEYPLHAQHLLHLVADGELVFENEREMLAELDGAILLVGHDSRPELRTLAGVGFKRHQACAVDPGHGCHRPSETGQIP